MKRIAQLFLLVLAVTTVSFAGGPPKGGGSGSHDKTAEYGYYCYATPGQVEDCGTLSSCACRAACEYDCDGPCDWDSSCPN